MAKDKSESQDQSKINKIQQKLNKLSPFGKNGEKKTKDDNIDGKPNDANVFEVEDDRGDVNVNNSRAEDQSVDMGRTRRVILTDEVEATNSQPTKVKKQSKKKPNNVSRSDQRKKKSKLGVEMVKASTEDVASLEQAMAGSYGVFAMTNYWELMDQAKEVEMGKNIVDVAKKVGVEHFVFSGLQSVKKAIEKACPHFDGKAEVEEYMFASGLSATSVRYAAFMENIFTQLVPQKVADGQYVWNIPMGNKEFDMVYTGRAGLAVTAIFKNPAEYIGKSVGLSGDRKTVSQYCEILNTHVAPATVTPTQMTAEEFAKLPFPGADDLGVMFEFLQTSHPSYNVDETKKLDPQTVDFEAFVKANKEKILAILK